MRRANLLQHNSQRLFVCPDADDVVLNEKNERCYKARYYGREGIILLPVHIVDVIEIAKISA